MWEECSNLNHPTFQFKVRKAVAHVMKLPEESQGTAAKGYHWFYTKLNNGGEERERVSFHLFGLSSRNAFCSARERSFQVRPPEASH